MRAFLDTVNENMRDLSHICNTMDQVVDRLRHIPEASDEFKSEMIKLMYLVYRLDCTSSKMSDTFYSVTYDTHKQLYQYTRLLQLVVINKTFPEEKVLKKWLHEYTHTSFKCSNLFYCPICQCGWKNNGKTLDEADMASIGIPYPAIDLVNEFCGSCIKDSWDIDL